MGFQAANQAKANFDRVYESPTPHAYIGTMARHGYEIGEQARPYIAAAAELLNELNPDVWPVHMLDVGCSYGLGAAFVKFGCSFDEMVPFFLTRAPKEYSLACEALRMWLRVTPAVCDIRCVGLDRSGPAIRFALDAGVLDGGVARDFEQPGASPTDEEAAWFRSCNLLASTGAIGYVTERSLGVILEHLGEQSPGDYGPFVVVTILRMFETQALAECFRERGLEFAAVPGIRLPQRRFHGDEERREVLSLLHDRGVDTAGWEDDGRLYADLFIGAPERQFSLLRERMEDTRCGPPMPFGRRAYICR